MQPESEEALDVDHVVGVFTRYNTSVDTPELTSEHCRHFYTYLHKQAAGPRLKKAFQESRDQAKKDLIGS